MTKLQDWPREQCDMNKVMLIGNVGNDPEVRYLEGNSKVATFRIATNEQFLDKDGKLKEVTLWHTVTVWRKMADMVEQLVRKGSQLYVEGRLRYRTWTDRSGTERTLAEIAGDSIEILDRKTAMQAAGHTKPETAVRAEQKAEKKKSGPHIEEVDDGIPF